MKVLIVEDSEALGKNLKKGVEEAGWTVDLAKDGEEGLQLLENGVYDVVAIDWMLPKISGIDLVKTLRKNENNVPIIMISARGSLQDRVEGIELGADDYIVKPFELIEFLVRLNALYRRSRGSGSSEMRVGALSLNLSSQQAAIADEPLDLTGMEFDLLKALVSNKDKLLERRELISLLYRFNAEPEGNSLDVLLTRLRKKLQGSGAEIANVRGKGFFLRVAKNTPEL